jgi:hypothetical protein
MWFAREGRDSRPPGRELVADQPGREIRTCGELQGASSKRYLTDDEIVMVAPCDGPCSFRSRIWRGKACPAIVLVSQLAGGPSPNWSSSQVANMIYRAYLGFPAEGMRYFEDEIVLGEPKLFFVEFRIFGHGLRRCLTWPIRHAFDWSDLKAMVGGEIPH